MFWKIIMWIYIIIYTILLFVTWNGMDIQEGTPWNIAVISYICLITLILCCGYFYAVGSKKQLFSKKANNIILGIFILSSILKPIQTIMSELPLLRSGEIAHNYAQYGIYDYQLVITGFTISLIIEIVVEAFLFWVLPIIAYVIYRKNCETYQEVEKSYWKIFACYLIYMVFVNLISVIMESDFYKDFYMFEKITPILSLFSLLAIIGFSFNKKIFPQIFWKIAVPVLIIFDVCAYIFMSEAKKAIEHSLYCMPCWVLGLVLSFF